MNNARNVPPTQYGYFPLQCCSRIDRAVHVSRINSYDCSLSCPSFFFSSHTLFFLIDVLRLPLFLLLVLILPFFLLLVLLVVLLLLLLLSSLLPLFFILFKGRLLFKMFVRTKSAAYRRSAKFVYRS